MLDTIICLNEYHFLKLGIMRITRPRLLAQLLLQFAAMARCGKGGLKWPSWFQPGYVQPGTFNMEPKKDEPSKKIFVGPSLGDVYGFYLNFFVGCRSF